MKKEDFSSALNDHLERYYNIEQKMNEEIGISKDKEVAVKQREQAKAENSHTQSEGGTPHWSWIDSFIKTDSASIPMDIPQPIPIYSQAPPTEEQNDNIIKIDIEVVTNKLTEAEFLKRFPDGMEGGFVNNRLRDEYDALYDFYYNLIYTNKYEEVKESIKESKYTDLTVQDSSYVITVAPPDPSPIEYTHDESSTYKKMLEEQANANIKAESPSKGIIKNSSWYNAANNDGQVYTYKSI